VKLFCASTACDPSCQVWLKSRAANPQRAQRAHQRPDPKPQAASSNLKSTAARFCQASTEIRKGAETLALQLIDRVPDDLQCAAKCVYWGSKAEAVSGSVLLSDPKLLAHSRKDWRSTRMEGWGMSIEESANWLAHFLTVVISYLVHHWLLKAVYQYRWCCA